MVVSGQSQAGEKSNEIKAIPELLEPIDIAGSVITIDAIGCQQAVPALLAKKQAGYIIGLKANQDGLYEQVVDWFEQAGAALPAAVSRKLAHGRTEKRIIQGHEALGLIDAAQGWAGLRSVVRLTATRWMNGKEQTAKRYYR